MSSSSIAASVPSTPSPFPPSPLRTSSWCAISRARRNPTAVFCGIRELRERIHSVKSTQKITEAMKLVAAARVRRAQDAVINSRPFTEKLLDFLCHINEQVHSDDIEVPLMISRPVRNVAIVVVAGDRGLCGGFNSAVIKKAENRVEELKKAGIDCRLISVGKKAHAHFRCRPSMKVERFIDGGGFPTAKEAQVIADEVFSMFVCEEVDKVELVYTKFVSLVKSDPVVQSLLPLSSKGEVLDTNGNWVNTNGDEFFRLTTKNGKLAVKGQRFGKSSGSGIPPLLMFEQDPVQILDAMMPLYLNSQILRALQESIASELAARMNAMSSATENAVELKKNLSIAYNRERQAKITGEILEIVAGAEALVDFD